MQSSSQHSNVEERVNRVREALSSKLLNTNTTSSSIAGGGSSRVPHKTTTATADDEMAAAAIVLADEARRSRELSMQLGPRAYLLKHSESGKHSSTDAYSGLQRVSDVNKTFLQNTIRSVESHNRREQIDGAWRQHGLLKKLDEGSLFCSSGSSRAQSEAVIADSSSVAATHTEVSHTANPAVIVVGDDQMDPLAMRQLWAARKAAVFSSSNITQTNYNTSATIKFNRSRSSSTEEGEVKTNKRRRDSTNDSNDSDNSDNNSKSSTSTTSTLKMKKHKKKSKKQKKDKKKKKSKKERKHKSK